MKNNIVFVVAVVMIVSGIFVLFSGGGNKVDKEQALLQETLTLSREYVALRYETDNLLLAAGDFQSYEAWSQTREAIMSRWQQLEGDSAALGVLAEQLSEESLSFELLPTVYAYDKTEIQQVFDKAPAGKKIATLAKHLGVDAKQAFAILRDEAQLDADAWNKKGDDFQKLETTAVVIKDVCKVATFVGTVALTGGTAAIVSGSTLGQVATVVAGADLALEVTDDAAKIALGNYNKVSSVIGGVRVVTEPAAAILMISTLPTNLTSGIEKLGAVTFGAEQLNSTIQEGKAIGIKLPTPTTANPTPNMDVSVLTQSEVSEWIQVETGSVPALSPEEVADILDLGAVTVADIGVDDVSETKTVTPPTTPEVSPNSASASPEGVVGTWVGILSFTQSAEADEQAMDFTLEIKPGGVLGGEAAEAYSSWELVGGNSLRLVIPNEEGGPDGYDEFRYDGKSLTYVKRAGINSEGVWQEDFAGSDFFGGKFMQIYLEKI